MSSDVITTLHNDDGHRCVKVIRRPNGTFGLQEFRRDPEDAGSWTLVKENSGGTYATRVQAVAAARAGVGWLREMASPAKD